MRYIICLLALCIGINMASAQEVYNSSGRARPLKEKKKHGYDPSRLIIGGGVDLGFGGGFTNLGISPIVGYRFTDRFSAGVGLGYQYIKEQQYLYNPSIADYQTYSTQANIIYPSVWSRFFVFRNFFVEGSFEYDILNFSDYNYDFNSNIQQEKFNVNVPCLLLGAGFRVPIAGRVSATAELLYDVLQHDYSPYYGIPVYRVGLCVGL